MDSFPYNSNIDTLIVMDEFVKHTGNLFPWDLIIFEFVIKLIIGIDY
jgi:hypothetical protein